MRQQASLAERLVDLSAALPKDLQAFELVHPVQGAFHHSRETRLRFVVRTNIVRTTN